MRTLGAVEEVGVGVGGYFRGGGVGVWVLGKGKGGRGVSFGGLKGGEGAEGFDRKCK